MKLVQYERQVVNGWNHRLVYKGDNKERTVTVYESIEGNLEINYEGDASEM